MGWVNSIQFFLNFAKPLNKLDHVHVYLNNGIYLYVCDYDSEEK